jgi:hypothetical protein
MDKLQKLALTPLGDGSEGDALCLSLVDKIAPKGPCRVRKDNLQLALLVGGLDESQIVIAISGGLPAEAGAMTRRKNSTIVAAS